MKPRQTRPMPTLGELVAVVCADFGGELFVSSGLVGPRGPARFERIICPGGRFAVLPDVGNDTRLTPKVVRTLCAQLGIPSAVFGLEQIRPK